ncbi:MAG: ecotin family protein [Planctomycetota bacterium]|jgi:ecotin
MFKSFLTLSILILGSFAMAQQPQDNMKAYPPAADGMKRVVVYLESKEEEDDYRIELMVGKTVEVDAANRFFFSGTLEEETIEGWGFPKYIVKQIGPMAGTRIGVDPDAPKVKRFVKLGGEPKLLRYNSKLPLVVYVPKDAEVKLKVWVASPQPVTLNEG